MEAFDITEAPRCTIDFPLEISPDEILSLSGPVNTLLKCSYLLGTSLDFEPTFQSLFDIAEEIAGVEACGFLYRPDDHPGPWEVRCNRHVESSPSPERLPLLLAPASLGVQFRKPVLLDPETEPAFQPVCDAWSSRSLVAFPLRRDREIVGALVFGKRSSHPFTPVQVKLLWVLGMQAENRLQQSALVKTPSFYSFLDPLTHLYNRGYFHHQLEKEILRSRRSGESFSLLTLDLDGFKAYNDRFLQSSGDIALQEFAGILSGAVREVDTVRASAGTNSASSCWKGTRKGRKPWRSASSSGSSGTCCRGKRNPAPSGCR